MSIKELQPQSIWKYFYEITQIPRPSKKEEKIIEYLLEFAKEHNLEAEKDKVGNVIIRKPGTKGKENLPGVILQSHTDMVCEKNSDTKHNFDTDPIQTYIEDGWVKAKGTTLGADDGIGVAASLAILAADNIEHGPLEALFTADEETGMSGAFGLKPGFMNGKILINLDSEDEGEVYIGCAGGVDTVAYFKFKKQKIKDKSFAFKINVNGLKGGHSGDDINKGLGNANKILNRLLVSTLKYKFGLNVFDGGNLRNALAREAYAVVTVSEKKSEKFVNKIKSLAEDIKKEFSVNEPDLKIEIVGDKLPEFVIDKKTQKNLLHSLSACFHGVYAMSADIAGLVETSTNLASVKFVEKNKIKIETSQRSSSQSAKFDMAQTVASAFVLGGAKVKTGEGYPGWKPNPNSEVLRASEISYKKLFDKSPDIKAIHAGLECGLFLEKYPYLDMVSIGPTVKGAHSPDERLEIESVQKFWDFLLEILKSI